MSALHAPVRHAALRVWCRCVESVIAVIVTICFDLNVLSCIFISFSSNEWNKIRQSEGDWEISLTAYDWYTISLNLSHLEWLAFLKNLRCYLHTVTTEVKDPGLEAEMLFLLWLPI